MVNFFKKLFVNYNDHRIKQMLKYVHKINSYEIQLQKLNDTCLADKTAYFKQMLANGADLNDLLPEAFAVVREVSNRILGMRHFDVQLLGGLVLHGGNIAEMRTGEGKTLVATAPVYLNALTGKGVHVVTVNDYLANRDSEWMGKIYRFLNLSVGLIIHGLTFLEKKTSYNADITYGTNNEFGFDYLRDNLVSQKDQMVQRSLNYAIIDEVDSILIDEARTPLIISGPGEKSTNLYFLLSNVVLKLIPLKDYLVDEKARTVIPTESGIAKVEKILNIKNLYDAENIEISHHFQQALKASALMKRDKDYVVKDDSVIIVDEFTGRLMFGRRYSDGLHQAIEAKEGVKIERESQTLASITFQNYFRMYKKLAGMTGTAKTEEQEFRKIYNLDVIIIPTNRPSIRIDYPDIIFKNKRAKYKAVIREIEARHAKGQPVLVGTTSITQSEYLGSILRKKNIIHNVLNAKFHEMEAQIISQAGQKGMITIATNMAGRGTDIVLGKKIPELGGLHIIGTERHESRRIDNQLRGRCARQGDAGSTRFYLSLEDDLMRLFGSDNISLIMDKLGMSEDDPIEHTLITRSIEKAQKRVEAHNFGIRKHILEYDDVMNQQRKIIYSQRRKILEGSDLKENILSMVDKILEHGMNLYANEKTFPDECDYIELIKYIEKIIGVSNKLQKIDLEKLTRDNLLKNFKDLARIIYSERENSLGNENMREFEKVIMLRVVDNNWMNHLSAMDMLREGIGLRSYGQLDPLIEYKIEAFDMFQETINSIQEEIVNYIYTTNIIIQPEDYLSHAKAIHNESDLTSKIRKTTINNNIVGRNEICPCGSGKKYKKCCVDKVI